MTETLLDQTLARFPDLSKAAISIQPLEKGGSDRRYYRIAVGGAHSLILVKYGQQREENRHYVEIARFLGSLGSRVPAVYFHDESEGLIWMEDLGELDLWSFRESAWSERGALYRETLNQAVHLHSTAIRALGDTRLTLQVEFNTELYLWEQQYFFENCLGRFFRLDPNLLENLSRSSALIGIAERLSSLPRVLIHRDFQSQNIMIRDGAAYLIDFQGLRPGLAHYDLASLIYDPYVELSREEREELVHYYISRSLDAGADVPADFLQILDHCALQRLMQALGAYGFLGLVKQKPHFLSHIPVALGSLLEVVARIPGLEELSETLSGLTIPEPV